MKKLFVGLMAVALAFFGASALNTSVLAEEEATEEVTGSSLQMSPIGVRLRLNAGETLQGNEAACRTSVTDSCSVQITNVGKEKFRYKVHFTPYTITNGNNDAKFVDGENASFTQLSRWLTVRNSDNQYVDEAIFSIEPGETQTVYYRIQVPDDVPGGSQFAVLWATILTDKEVAGGIKTSGQVGSQIIGRTNGESKEEAEVSNLKMSRFSINSTLKASGKVKNNGNTDFDINATYRVRTIFGKELFSKTDRNLAYPGIEYEPTVVWEDAPMLGIYHADFTIDAASESQHISRIVVVMPIFAMILLILLLTVIVTWIIIIIRKRKERKARKLV